MGKTIQNNPTIPESLGDCRFLFMETKTFVSRLNNLDVYPTSRSNYKINLLCDAIRKQGILTPIIAIKTGNKYELIDGLKRLFCAIEHNISPIPVMLCGYMGNLGSATTLAINNVRFRPCGFELLNGIYMLVNEKGIDINDVSRALMKSSKTIKNWLATMNKFYGDIYPQFTSKDYIDFIEFVEKECFSASKIMFCINKASSPEQLRECLVGGVNLHSPTEIKEVKEVHNAIKRTGAKAEDIKDALMIYSALNKYADKMPKECEKFLEEILKTEEQRIRGDNDGDDE